jgi:hypothetical protein
MLNLNFGNHFATASATLCLFLSFLSVHEKKTRFQESSVGEYQVDSSPSLAARKIFLLEKRFIILTAGG